MSSYTDCPCCGGKRRVKVESPGEIYACRKCDALYGDCYKGDSFTLVRPYMTSVDVPTDRMRYFDFTVVGSDGVTRRHGWYDRETRLTVQVG